jgi:Zn-dependent peptidase ImmA (M78 family)
LAATVKDTLGYGGRAAIPTTRLIEFDLPRALPSFVYDVQTMSQMGSNEGLASPDRDFIAFREDVWEGALRGRGRDRFTVAHEVGHLILHQKENIVLRRATSRPAMLCRPEWQANTFAAEFLMDYRQIDPNDTEVELARRFGVSIGAASRRLRTLTMTGAFEQKSEPRLSPGSLQRT